jgi:hypothetical protein
MRRLAKWAALAGVLAVIVALFWAGPKSREENPDSQSANPRAVGTMSRTAPPRPIDAEATLHDLETMTGVNDPNQLIGRRVDFEATVTEVNNYVMWTGTGDSRVLVVLGRDNRNQAQRMHGGASPNDIKPVHAGQAARITGTIEPIPYAEARNYWGLTEPQRKALDDLKVYIRADAVLPNE